ncbi:MAG: hypothetical protein ACKO7W_13485 [Elainella sp.]
MLESWLLQIRLFPRRFWQALRWQALQALAQRFLAAVVGLVMPLALFVGFSQGFSSSASRSAAPVRTATALEFETWRNLSHPRAEAKPEDIPAREQCDRRGARQERRTGREPNGLPVVETASTSELTLAEILLPALGEFDASWEPLPVQTQPQTWTYQTLLPWSNPVLWSL